MEVKRFYQLSIHYSSFGLANTVKYMPTTNDCVDVADDNDGSTIELKGRQTGTKSKNRADNNFSMLLMNRRSCQYIDLISVIFVNSSDVPFKKTQYTYFISSNSNTVGYNSCRYLCISFRYINENEESLVAETVAQIE